MKNIINHTLKWKDILKIPHIVNQFRIKIIFPFNFQIKYQPVFYFPPELLIIMQININ